MTEASPGPVQRVFGAALIAAGFLLMLLCGGCGALFFIGFLISGLTSSNTEDVGMVLFPLVLGGIPAAVGFGLFALGRSLRRQPRAPRPDPLNLG